MKYIPGGRTISRILYPFPNHREQDGDHLSNAAYPWVRRSGSPRVPPEISGINFPPIWPCSGRGLPRTWRHRQTGELLPHLFTLTPILRGGLFSVALSVISSRPDAPGSRRDASDNRSTLPCGVRTFLPAPNQGSGAITRSTLRETNSFSDNRT